jgi:voltage-gated potassium channel
MRTGGLTAGKKLAASLALMALVVVTGTVGYMAFGYGFLSAVFQTVTTVTTVGFGELHPFTAGEEVFTIFLILFGVGAAAYALSVMFQYFVEGYLGGTFRRRRMDRDIQAMRHHVIVCGWGRVGTAIVSNLNARAAEVVVVDLAADRLVSVGGPFVEGDATDEAVLRSAGIDHARVLITALNEDADNLYVTLTARSMRPDLFIVSRVAREQAVAKLRQAGANRVVNPQDLGGVRMAAFALQPHVAEFLDTVMHDGDLEFRLEEVEIPDGSTLAGQTLRSARIHEHTGTLVLAMREPGAPFRTNPPPTAEIVAGEVLIVVGDADQVARLRGLAGG